MSHIFQRVSCSLSLYFPRIPYGTVGTCLALAFDNVNVLYFSTNMISKLTFIWFECWDNSSKSWEEFSSSFVFQRYKLKFSCFGVRIPVHVLFAYENQK
jgi:hypothetical protein